MICFFGLGGLAQNLKPLHVKGLNANYVTRSSAKDSTDALLWSQKTLQRLQKDGYWMASIDAFENTGDQYMVEFFQGRKFDGLNVNLTHVSGVETFLNRRFLRQQRSIKNTVDFHRFVESTLELYENNGYPFANLSFDSISMDANSIAFGVRIQKGPSITYDSISVNPEHILKPQFLANYLNLKYNGIYRESDIQNIVSKMNRFQFLDLRKSEVTYQLNQAKTALEFKTKKVNYFDGILGVVPNRDNEGIELTGELNLSVKNLLQSAKELEIHWTKLRPGSQLLEAWYYHPVFLGTPLGVRFKFYQIKEDTLYSNQRFNLRFDYAPNSKLNTAFFYESRKGNELDDGSELSGDFGINFYGLSAELSDMDDLYFPKSGWKTRMEISVGDKTDNLINSQSTQYRLKANLESYNPLSSISVLYGRISGGHVIGDQLYLNDLFRIGGLKSVRGFDELAIFASKYLQTTAEWRIYFEAQSYLVTFFDLAWTQFEVLDQQTSDHWQGFGAGINMSTANGQFTMLYAFGRNADQSFSFDSSKLHLGYTANF